MQNGPGERSQRLPKPQPVVNMYVPNRYDVLAIGLRILVVVLAFLGVALAIYNPF